MFVNELLAEAIVEIMVESEVHILAQQQLINVFRDSLAKKEELAHMIRGVICAEVADCEVVDR